MLELPLCEEHDRQLALARRRRPIVIAAAAVGLLVALIGMGLDSIAVALGGVVIVIGAAIVVRSLRMNEAGVPVASVTEQSVALRVDPDLARDLAARAAKREADRARGPSTDRHSTT